MNALNINAEIMQQLGYIADDEDLMKKVLKYIKRIVSHKEEAATEAYVPRTKEEILGSLDQSFKEIKFHSEGKIELKSAYELIDEL